MSRARYATKSSTRDPRSVIMSWSPYVSRPFQVLLEWAETAQYQQIVIPQPGGFDQNGFLIQGGDARFAFQIQAGYNTRSNKFLIAMDVRVEELICNLTISSSNLPINNNSTCCSILNKNTLPKANLHQNMLNCNISAFA